MTTADQDLMKQLFALIVFLALSVLPTSAQQFTLQGRVLDEDMNGLEFAMVSVASQGKTVFTTIHGNFSMTLQSADSVSVRFSLLGYKPRTKVLRRPRGKQTQQIVLQPNEALAEVVVEGQKIQTSQSQELKSRDMRFQASASGNAVESLIQTQPGVSSHDELSSQYNVRGGSFNENVVFLNDVEVYRPFLVRSGQQEGLSIINPYMVDRIGFSTGGFEPKYGDQMSSALDIQYKTLKPGRVEGALTASLLGGDAYLGLATKKLTWLNSVRYKTNRYLLGTLDNSGEYHPRHLDYQTFLKYYPNRRWELSLVGNVNDSHYTFIPESRNTAFGTMDNALKFKVYFNGQEKDLFTTYFGSVALTRYWGKGASLSLLASAYSTREQEAYDIEGQYWLQQTSLGNDIAVGTYFEHSRDYLTARVGALKLMYRNKTSRHDVQAAVSQKWEHIKENANEYEMRDSAGYSLPHTGKDLNMIYAVSGKNELRSRRTEVYLQDTYRFTDASQETHFTLNYGIRMGYWNYNKETIVSPRVALGVVPAFSPNSTFRLAAGVYYQAPFYKELKDTAMVGGVARIGLNRKIESQRSIHLILGYENRFIIRNRKYRFSAEAYYKALDRMTPYSVNNVKVVYYGSNQGKGHTAGLDLKLYGEFVPETDSWLSVSLMSTGMKLDGKRVVLPTDQRYSVNLFFTDYFPMTDRWKASLNLVYTDGLPFFAPHRELEATNFRAPAYKRVDLGISYRLYNNQFRERKSVFKDVWLSLEGLNLFGVNNVNSYYWITDVSNVQYAIPNYLTGRRVNAKIRFDF